MLPEFAGVVYVIQVESQAAKQVTLSFAFLFELSHFETNEDDMTGSGLGLTTTACASVHTTFIAASLTTTVTVPEPGLPQYTDTDAPVPEITPPPVQLH